MVPASLAFLLALWLSFFNLELANSSDQVTKTDVQPSPTACVDCTVCPYPCHNNLSPLPPGYPLYDAPPPPPPPLQLGSGYPIYGVPPPPQSQVQGNCPPAPVQCCGGTGIAHAYPPPYTYTYMPSESYSALYHSTIPIFSVVIVLVSFTVLF